ncbi:hypothetical protein OJF2_38110 [Aquisphaera giovannonii]|uniref:Uncharacterized protein n=1 Tax=Aquisphaera giovannonii TaxID=406548 RepID=A0A5B9W3R7_9BACT|nr:hypothetical protein [Aquisphaera giovannonii]QEH35263.1 hypothetical protein OJF2_38110 [Aquisphaera giovannonii]
MRRIVPTIVLISAAASAAMIAAGCGDSSPGVMVKPAPSGGAMTRLKNVGFFTIKAEGPAGAAGRKKNAARSLVVMVFGPDAATPMSPPPTDVVVNLDAAGKTTPVPLKPDDKEPGRFVSAPGPYPTGLQGEVRMKVGGEDVGESFSAM